jgi:hypothetical protein
MGLYQEARQLARQAAPAVMERLIELALSAADERVSSVCCVAVLDRAYGRPREAPEVESLEERIANMTREERLARMAELLAPMRAYLDEEDNKAEGDIDATVEVEVALSPSNPSPQGKPSGRTGTARARSVTGG